MLKVKLGGVKLHAAVLDVRNRTTKEPVAASFVEYLETVNRFF